MAKETLNYFKVFPAYTGNSEFKSKGMEAICVAGGAHLCRDSSTPGKQESPASNSVSFHIF